MNDLPPHITQWSDLDGVTLTPAEQKVMKAAKVGETAAIGTSILKAKTEAVLVRAPLLRYLILGGCEACSTKTVGVLIKGAWIEGILDLNFATTSGQIGFLTVTSQNSQK